jgi:RhtB (resistance to homoserine/threonine) family protein
MEEFFLLGFALAASPGPDFLLMTKHTLINGRRIGYSTLLGNRFSLILHMSFAFLGLSVIIQKSALLFTIVRILGAAYLIYLGYKNIVGRFKSRLSNQTKVDLNEGEKVTVYQAVQRGFLSNFLNPKVSLFFLSIFPQFASPEQLSQQPLTIALVFLSGNSLWYVSVLLIIGIKSIRMAVQRFQKWLDLTFGFLFVAFGLNIIWSELSK